MARKLNTTPVTQSKVTFALGKIVVGQDEALQKMAEILTIHNAGLDPEDRPIASVYCAGPTGVGKTESWEALAHYIHGDRKKLIRVDCAEFQHGHEISKLIGAPPGYLGHEASNIAQARLSQDALTAVTSPRSNISLVLFDEIEKADEMLFNILLSVLSKATLTLGNNQTVSWKNTIVGFASNIAMRDLMAKSIGFRSMVAPSDDQTETAVEDGMQKKYSPEFRNRIDHVIVYKYLTPDDIRRIINIELSTLSRQINHKIKWTKSAGDFLIAKGYSKQYGARFLSRTVRKYIKLPLANALDNGDLNPYEDIMITHEEGEALSFTVTKSLTVGA